MRTDEELAALHTTAPSRRVRLVNALLRRAFRGDDLGSLDPDAVAVARQRMVAMTTMTEPAGLHRHPDELGGRPAVRYDRDDTTRDDLALLWLHGGAYVMGSPATHAELCNHLAAATRVPVWALDYRLAPEHAFPAWLDDAVAAHLELVDRHGPERVAVGGDSAGGGLALALVQRLRDEGAPLPAAVVALSPWTDLLGEGRSWVDNDGTDPIIAAEGLRAIGRGLIGGHDPHDPLLSPRWAELTGCPPLLVEVGSTEVLADDARAVVEAQRAAGGTAVLSEWPEAPHVFPAFARWLPEGRGGILEVAAFLADHLPHPAAARAVA